MLETSNFPFSNNIWKSILKSLTLYFTKDFKLQIGWYLKHEGHDGPVSLHWLIREIHSYQTLHYLGIGLKHKTPYKD